MICASCGGTIHVNESCKDCGIEFKRMLNDISHGEMKRLFKRIDENNSRNIDLEASLMACELLNSSLILPACIENDRLGIVQLPGIKNRKFIAVVTDMDEFNQGFKSLTPLTNSWQRLLDLLDDDVEGFVINPFGECCYLGRDFLNPYFEVNNDNL